MDLDERDHFAGLVRAVADERDQAAFAVLFDYYGPRLKSWLVKRSMRPDDAEELVQEVMAVLWHRAGLYDPARSSLSTWLFRIARNRRIDAERRERHKQMDIYEPLFFVTETPGADTIFEGEERDAQVRAALADIPGEQMELVRAAFFLGQSHSEIASATGLPLGTVKSRIRLAFERLRRVLDDPSEG
ncbi:sigma-70 family RNA polymerase sigma factor [Neorhizobium galegae]|uniref:sigma-70 family RNA polymerase sigma factor n=1 Tax=Neorhizobium galegae TaxID=399 RepID=UPI000621FD4D|nr:sigma-70 family RNA polymerase sigma factor [Neorhizobium galegae]CDZ27150.1 RpoE [Neorhizobium galegae bv. officinalis]KAA9384995.1 sigma-70 family RNA polymerase sigma factor [Neorhizobium galegae]KAB1116309.1 sigma-70 family RNA polymerase sigma factor [Neorhizobium galegae]MCM2497728.1 sigma-70 family RNA polymerase sigma factor [Neorhizobium galegae]MCQ1768837.1 sigma-70 family RNA polymerase sigma factor [Neorhizobium galegae]